jgi:AcrR family transcriptional regulator
MTDASAVLDRAADAALELAADRPWAAITLGEIAERAGVSFAELYARTPSKSALLDRVLQALRRGGRGDRTQRRDARPAVRSGYGAARGHGAAPLSADRHRPRRAPGADRRALAAHGRDAAGGGRSAGGGAGRGGQDAGDDRRLGAVLQVWRDDEGALNRTMAEIDSGCARCASVWGGSARASDPAPIRPSA